MRSEQDVTSTVIEIISNHMQIDPSEITRNSHFTADLNMDSLDIVEVTMEFEDNFDVTIPDEKSQSILTVGDAIDYVMSLPA